MPPAHHLRWPSKFRRNRWNFGVGVPSPAALVIGIFPAFRRPEPSRWESGSTDEALDGVWNSNCSTSSKTGRECAGPVSGSTLLPDTTSKDSAGFRTRSRNKDDDRTLLPPRLPLKFPQFSGTGPIRLRFFERTATQIGASPPRIFRRYARSRFLAVLRAEQPVTPRKSL